MFDEDWTADKIFAILDSGQTYDFNADITVLKFDKDLKVVLGFNDRGMVFFGFPQVGSVAGFKKGRAKLDVSLTIDLEERGVIEPALALSFLVNSEDELMAISAIFSGLYDLNKSAKGSDRATLAAQGFEEFFADMPKIGLSHELEIGLIGELSIIAMSSKKEELVRGWHASPTSTYDFSYNGQRLEVKSGTRPSRIVWLRASQSLNEAEENLNYLSIYVPLDDAGMNLLELIELIRNTLDPSIKSIFDEKLAIYEIDECRRRFDFAHTVGSFHFVSSENIPKPILEDSRVLDIRWKCSFQHLPAITGPNPWI